MEAKVQADQMLLMKNLYNKNAKEALIAAQDISDLNFVLNGTTPLIQAIRAGLTEVIELLLQKGAKVNMLHEGLYDTPLIAAISIADTALALRLIIEEGANINSAPSPHTFTALGAAIQAGELSFAIDLINRGAEIYPTNTSLTPLMAAATSFHIINQEPIVNLLLERSNLIDQKQLKEALLMLTNYDPNNIADLFLSKIFDVNAVVENNKTLLDIAIERRADNFAKKLMQYGAKVETRHLEAAESLNSTQLIELLGSPPEAVSVPAPFKPSVDNGSITTEQAQAFLERWQFEDNKNKNYEYTEEQIKNIINIPLKDGKSVLSNFLEWNNIEKVKFIITRYNAKIKPEHFKILRDKMQSFPHLDFTTKPMLEMLKDVAMQQNTENTLSYAIKYNLELADKLLAAGTTINADTVMNDLSEAIEYGNHKVIKILLKHNVPVDWNAPIEGDQFGDSLMIKLAKNPLDFNAVAEYITIKDTRGLPVFKINQENNNGIKLIDIFKLKLDAEGSAHKSMINLLRKCGSSEPYSKIVPESDLKLDVENIHNALNEKPFRDMQHGLHQEYDLNSLDKTAVFNEIRKYMNLNQQHLRFLLGDEKGEALEKGLENLEGIKTLNLTHNEHNNAWNTQEEVALVYLTCKKIGVLEKFIEVVTEMHSCEWGMVVNLYKIIQNGNKITNFKSILDFSTMQKPEAQNSLAESVYNNMLSSGMSPESVNHAIGKFFEELNNVDSKIYSRETEMVMGYFFSCFEKEVIAAGKEPTEIYSSDMKEFLGLVQALVMAYDADESPSNSLYRIMHMNNKNTTVTIHMSSSSQSETKNAAVNEPVLYQYERFAPEQAGTQASELANQGVQNTKPASDKDDKKPVV